MAQFPLLTTTDRALLAPRPSTTTGLAGVANGQVVRAEVIKQLGDALFSVSIRGQELTARSNQPLTPGESLDVEVNRAAERTVELRVVDRRAPDPAQVPPREVDQRTAATSTARPGATPDAPVREAPANARPATLSESAISAARLRPDGAVAELAARRPDLVGRLEALAQSLSTRGEPVGREIEQLVRELRQVSTLPTNPATSGRLARTTDRLLDQVFDRSLLADPGRLANQLATKLPDVVGNLERLLASPPKATTPPPAPPSPTVPAAPNSAAAPNSPVGTLTKAVVVEQALETLPTRTSAIPEPPRSADGVVPPRVPTNPSVPPPASAPTSSSPTPPAFASPGPTGPTPTSTGSPQTSAVAVPDSNPPAIVQRTVAGDLKGQLVDLRSQLQAIAGSRPESAGVLQSAIARTDLMIEQITAQQLRNVNGLQQYLHVEIPVDPRSGLEQAHLQVFYRQKNGKADMLDDDRFTVALFLQMSQLGDVMATVTGIDGSVSISLAVEEDHALESLDSSIEELRAGLLAAGHQGATIHVKRYKPKQSAGQAPSTDEDAIWDAFLDQLPLAGGYGARLNREV